VWLCAAALILTFCGSAGAQDKGKIVEEVIARVNNDAITRGDLDHARMQMQMEVEQECQGCSPAQIKEKQAALEKNLLRDLIDNSLMVQRAKDMGLNVETEVIKRLDEIRQSNKIGTMEDLERQVNQSGLDFEDFKNNIRNQLLQQEVIRREVGSKIILDHGEVHKYYEEHKSEFVRPEQVALREIFVSTEGKPESELPALRKKAEGLLERVKNGEDFGELAKRFSEGSTAKQSGELGTFERGQLAAALEDVVFKLKRNETTDVMTTKTGFMVLQVQEHYAAGQQPEDKVESEIMNHLYTQRMQPAMRGYLDNLRANSYVDVKPGYVDSAAVASGTIEEVAPTPDESEQKKAKSKLGPLLKKKNGA